MALLAETFPNAFRIQPNRRRLAISIHYAIRTALGGAVSNTELAAAMRHYCGNIGYLEHIVVGAQRVDLQDNPVAVVGETEAVIAKQKLAEAYRQREKRAASSTNPTNRATVATNDGGTAASGTAANDGGNDRCPLAALRPGGPGKAGTDSQLRALGAEGHLATIFELGSGSGGNFK